MSGSGLVTGVLAGPATITATSGGQFGTSAITVSGVSARVDTVFAEDFESGNLSAWQDALRRSIRQKVSWTAPQNLHVTLKFIGETDARLSDVRSRPLLVGSRR